MTRRRGQNAGGGGGRGGGVDEGPSESDLEQFGGVTRPCPKCQTELYDEVEICWKCGHHLGGEREAPPVWIIVTVVTLLFVIAGWWMLR